MNRDAAPTPNAAQPVKTGRAPFGLGRGQDYARPSAERVLVALLPGPRDWDILRREGWYRIPAASAPDADYDHLAFYFGHSSFGERAWQVGHYAAIERAQRVTRRELFPDQNRHPRADREYFKFSISELQSLEPPIVSRAARLAVFVPTTLDKLHGAAEFNDLFHDSPLEDELWGHLKAQNIGAERQWFLSAGGARYCLDFALFCVGGNINIECDGDFYHANAEKSRQDNARNNALTSDGWAVLRFNTHQISYEMPQCLKAIRGTIRSNGGLRASQAGALR